MTYDLFAAYWPLQTQNEFGIADKLNREPKYVVSSTLKEAGWQKITILAGNVVAEITTLKQPPGASRWQRNTDSVADAGGAGGRILAFGSPGRPGNRKTTV